MIAEQLPVFAADVTTHRTNEYLRVRERVATRLTREVNRLYTEALKTDADAAAGKKVRYSAETLRRRAEGAGIRIEVKARIEGSDTFTITRTEVLTALNAAPDHRLALVRVSASGPQHDEVCYIGNAFEGVEPAWLTDFDVVSQNLSWNDWWARGGEPF